MIVSNELCIRDDVATELHRPTLYKFDLGVSRRIFQARSTNSQYQCHIGRVVMRKGCSDEFAECR